MGALDVATLNAGERAVLEQFVETLSARMADGLHAVWLFGSRARGEAVDEFSDVDVLVIVDRDDWDGSAHVYEALHDAARELSLPTVAWSFSLHVHRPAWLDQRRAVESFFVAEVDRDHIDLTAAA